MAGIALGSALLLGFLLRDAAAGWAALPVGVAVASLWLAFRPWKQGIALATVTLVLILTGFWRAGTGPGDQPFPAGSGPTPWLEATVLDVPQREPGRTQARLHIRGPAEGDVVGLLPPYVAVSQGELLAVSGTLLEPQGMSHDGALPVLVADRVKVVGSEASRLQRARAEVTRWLRGRVEATVPQPAGALVTGVLLGDDGGMTEATREAFRAAGLSHLTAISGWNIAVVAGLCATLGRRARLAPRVWLPVAAAGIWVFSYLVGMGPSVTRAAVMGTLMLAAIWRGRPRDTLTALVLATTLIIAVTPAIRFDVGFQMSVAGTLGLAATAPYLDERSWWVVAPGVPLIAHVAIVPLLLYHFGTFSLVTPVANLPVAPLVVLVMLGGVIVGAASLLHPVAGEIAGLVAWAPARVVVAVAEWCAALPGASGTTIALGWHWLVAAYAALAAAYAYLTRPRPVRSDDLAGEALAAGAHRD